MLLLTILLFMGISGAVVASFTQKAKQDAEAARYKHNQRVLQQAKDALLMFAYNYPQTTGGGPGRLPCPDHDNDGNIDFPLVCNLVGRFPWGDPRLNIQETLDASGQRLWYAVSNVFDNFAGGGVINSDSLGTITLVDQAGNILYDGSVAGIAAVLIAPGPILERDNNGDGTYEYAQLRNTALQQNDPRNYLDTFGDFDNSAFLDFGIADADVFIIGPVYDNVVERVVVNDQIMIITAEEVIAMAEKATLQAYRDALQGYSDKIITDVPPLPGVWTQYYPWLYDYSGISLDDFPSDPLSNFVNELVFLGDKGRVPSIFSDYFTDSDSQPIESELNFDFALSYPVTPTTVGFDQVVPVIATGTWQFNNAAQHRFNAITTLPQIIQFSDYDSPGPNGRLSATAISFSAPYQAELWFWDEADLGPATGVWTICPDDGNGISELSDCNRDLLGNPTPGSANNLAGVEALRVIAQVDFPVGVAVNFDTVYGVTAVAPPVITATSTADGASHATIQGVYLGADMVNLPVTLSYELDRHYLALFNNLETGSVVASDLNLNNVTLGLRYYPELPGWVFTNNWHRSVQMAYAQPYRPDQIGPALNCTAGIDCLVFDGAINATNNKKALLVIAGEHDMVDGDIAPQPVDAPNLTLANELDDIFNPENSDADIFYDGRTVQDPLALGDAELDKILVIDEL